MAKTAVIVCAAGASSRFNGKQKKPFIEIDRKPVFLRSLEIFSSIQDVKQIIMAVSPEDKERVELRWGANLSFFNTSLCPGGKERFETVQNGLAKVNDDIEVVAIHDAARCCLTKEWAVEVIKKAAETGAAMLASPVVDTIKRVEQKRIVDTVDRRNLYAAQTPQVFKRELIEKGFANLEKLDRSRISDDSQLIEALGLKVDIVETDSSNIKITTKADVAIAEAILKYRQSQKKIRPLGAFEEAKW